MLCQSVAGGEEGRAFVQGKRVGPLRQEGVRADVVFVFSRALASVCCMQSGSEAP